MPFHKIGLSGFTDLGQFPGMQTDDLRKAIYEHLPGLDEILDSEKLPVHERTFRAAHLFVDLAVEAPEAVKQELLGSITFREGILPIVSDWYWAKYGSLCRDQRSRELSGILSAYAQPLLIQIPQTLSRVEVEGETLWLTLPDSLREDESIRKLTGGLINLAALPPAASKAVQAEAALVVGISRSINLNLMSKEGLDEETFSLGQTIWPHFEKAVRDLLLLTSEGAAAACWDLHLAVEKAFKVLIRSKQPGAAPFGHDLNALQKQALRCGAVIDSALVKRLPKEKMAIQFRYAEALVSTATAIDHYKTALELVDQITREIPRKLKLNNTSFLIKMAPWAK